MTIERWPTELRLAKDRRSLRVVFDDGTAFDLPAEYLRVTSPSAEVQGHSPAERKTVPGKKDVEIIGVEPVGNYAVKLVFDDLHDSGIYGWGYLYELGAQYEEKWQAYLDELAARGLSRERLR
ncbi:gamma-butyrobetaine hydroxylase-like domain-containing protein [Microvirga sp. G4-2]|uniref:gamma-butyrobetaine hydroxylase-like domain-containing protein n=1 Tax=Microvirga sp. G4-2 TaxID=3434467 RepID=UPI004043FDEB